RQVSACFLAAELAPGAPRFTRKERAKGFKVEWHPFGQVIVLLQRERPVDYEGKFIVKRDLRFLHEAAGVANK
ncbi:MAG TPA: hypothetical protein VJB16_02515, partial [archaeon]|nr:hypothetical protein [archaeon]